MGITEDSEDRATELRAPTTQQSRGPSRSRNSSVNGRIGADDFDFGRVLGEGSYSTVMLARHRGNGQEYAIKVLDKGHLKRNNKLATALAEKNTLVRLGAEHPGIVHLHFTFQDEWSLFFVLDLARNGELQSRISRMGSLSTECARYYTAQLIDALDYMHSKGVIHRDLKPENLLLDDNYRLKLTDFGTGKILSAGVERAKTWVGTPQYISPELLEVSETSRSSDLWALGCILYQMIAGRFAFVGLSEYLTWQKIKALDYSFPDGFDEQAKDLVSKLLVRDPAERLGAGLPGSANDMRALRSHPYFSSIDWKTLWTSPAPPLEAGLVKKDAPVGKTGGTWDDGALWDEVVDSNRDDDEISWASDDEVPVQIQDFKFQDTQDGAPVMNGDDHDTERPVGPLGESRPYAFPTIASEGSEGSGRTVSQPAKETNGVKASSHHVASSSSSGVRFLEADTHDQDPPQESQGEPPDPAAEAEEDRDKVAATLDDIPTTVRTSPIDVPASSTTRDSYSASSATSSSDGSPPSAALDAALARGRNRAQTPIQGHEVVHEEDWSSLLAAGETVLFNGLVDKSALRRRASRLLAIAGAPRRKTRELVLTDRRLVCRKHKPGRPHQVSNELTLRPAEREKDSKTTVVAVEPKGEREFVVMTGTKSYPYITSSASLASTWIRKIREALAAAQANSKQTSPKQSPKQTPSAPLRT